MAQGVFHYSDDLSLPIQSLYTCIFQKQYKAHQTNITHTSGKIQFWCLGAIQSLTTVSYDEMALWQQYNRQCPREFWLDFSHSAWIHIQVLSALHITQLWDFLWLFCSIVFLTAAAQNCLINFRQRWALLSVSMHTTRGASRRCFTNFWKLQSAFFPHLITKTNIKDHKHRKGEQVSKFLNLKAKYNHYNACQLAQASFIIIEAIKIAIAVFSMAGNEQWTARL